MLEVGTDSEGVDWRIGLCKRCRLRFADLPYRNLIGTAPRTETVGENAAAAVERNAGNTTAVRRQFIDALASLQVPDRKVRVIAVGGQA